MNKSIIFGFLLLWSTSTYGQRTLSIEECRSLALSGNKELAIKKEQREAAHQQRKAAHTNYLPAISATGSYVRNQKETSLLSEDTKHRLSHLGTTTMQNLSAHSHLGQALQGIVMKHPELSPLVGALGQVGQQLGGAFSQQLNGVGASLVDALRTDTRNLYLGAISITQPIYMGGKIRAYNQITRHAEAIAAEQERAGQHEVVLQVDQTYWQVVSLANKLKLAESYLALLQKLESDVEKMITAGVATRSDALSVRVKVNEAEMSVLKVTDGLLLSRMLLCQLCGLDLNEEIRLADEALPTLPLLVDNSSSSTEEAYRNRPELRSLELLQKIEEEKITLAKAEYRPSLALVGNYAVTNPSFHNGFQNKFSGMWNVGVMLRVPIWNWGQGNYKVRAAQAEARAASLRIEEVKERVALQLDQAKLKLSEANKMLQLTASSMDKAEENLRFANIGFSEGVLSTTNVLEAQTAWLSAHSAKIDAAIDYRLARVYLNKALGKLPE